MLSIIVPVYDEDIKNIDRMSAIFAEKFAAESIVYELVLIDDGSKKSNAAALSKWHQAQTEKKIVLIRNSKNIGYGRSIKIALHKAKYDKVALIDADNTYDPKDLIMLYNNIGISDMIIGKRINEKKAENIVRTLIKWY